MLVSLYPQRWLPYRYLWPFLWNWWDNETALQKLSTQKKPPKVLLLSAEGDELVPAEHGEFLRRLCRKLGLNVQFESVPAALHHEATARREGKTCTSKFIQGVGEGKSEMMNR